MNNKNNHQTKDTNEKRAQNFSYLFHTKSGRKNLWCCVLSVIIAFIFLFPLYWMLQISFKSDMETFGKVLTYFPHQFTIDPWLANLKDKDFIASLKNSFRPSASG